MLIVTPPPCDNFFLSPSLRRTGMYITKQSKSIRRAFKLRSARLMALIISSFALATSPDTQALVLKDTVFAKAGAEYNVDPALLYSIALVESAIDAPQKGFLKPSPWTLRTNKPFYAKSKQEAEALLERLMMTNKSIDVGMMQINLKWHGHRVKSAKDLLDPLTNVRVGAQIISEQIKRYPNDAALAVGNYHSSRPDRARWYARHVLRVYTNLKSQKH